MPQHKNRVVLPGSERSVRPGSRVVGAPDPNELIEISVLVRPSKPLDTLASAKELGASAPHQRRYLSREEFAATYGANPNDLNKIQAFAHDHNLTVVEVSPARRTVVLSGTVAAMSAAYGVYLASYVPDDLDGIVQGIFGFDNRPQARPHFRHFKPKTDKTKQMRASSQPSYTPPQVAALYNFPSGATGAGECIGILEFGGGYTTRDLNTYFKQLGIPAPSVTAVSVDGVHNKPAPGQDSPDTEVMLDIEVAGSVAPGASLAVYFSHFTERGWVDAVTTAVHDSQRKPSVLSISWGFAEGQDIWSGAAIQAVNEAFQAGAAMGVTVCWAAGDDGARAQGE